MRKIAIVDEFCFDKFTPTGKDYTQALTNVFNTIASQGGTIAGTKYLCNSHGRLTTAIIEYDIKED